MNKIDYAPDHTDIRKKLIAKHENRCQTCHKKPRTGQVLHMHHIDGNKKNNKLCNLMILCARCHAKKHGFKLLENRRIPKYLKNTNIKYMLVRC